MTELEIFEKAAKLARERKIFENALHDIEDFYFKNGTINLNINTQAHTSSRKYSGVDIRFDKNLMRDYINLEVKRLSNEIKDLVAKLEPVEEENPDLPYPFSEDD